MPPTITTTAPNTEGDSVNTDESSDNSLLKRVSPTTGSYFEVDPSLTTVPVPPSPFADVSDSETSTIKSSTTISTSETTSEATTSVNSARKAVSRGTQRTRPTDNSGHRGRKEGSLESGDKQQRRNPASVSQERQHKCFCEPDPYVKYTYDE